MTDPHANLTDEQRRAILQKESSVALRAGAGCGKTTVLTERYLQELSGPSPRPLHSMVALTFTDKAARELRNRIRKRCHEMMSSPGEDRGYWRSILLGLDSAPIGTFHSFCGQILRRSAIEIGLDPEFAVADEQIAPILRDDAVSRSISRWLADQDPRFIALASEYGIEPIRQVISSGLQASGGFDLKAWAERDPQEILAELSQRHQNVVVPILLTELVQSSGEMLQFLRFHQPSSKIGRERRSFLLETLPGLASAPNPSELTGELHDHAMVKGDKATSWADKSIYDQVMEFYKQFRAKVKAFQNSLEWNFETSIAAIAHGQDIANLIIEARLTYADIKQARGVIDFDDQMVMTRDLLRGATPATLMVIRSKIQFLLVDEFQDTDPTQVEILNLLRGGSSLRSANFTIVGDRKQSIYRFRNARPQLFDELHDAMPSEGQLRLSANFRSHPALISFFNILFETTFPGEELNAGLKDLDPIAIPRVDLLMPQSIEGDDDSDARVDERRATEAIWIARLIKHRLEQGWMIPNDQSASGTRRARAGDIAILLGNMGHARYHESALSDLDLDYHVIGGKAFYSRQEVIDLINLLSAIEDPTDALAMAGSLRGPFFGLSDEALYWLAKDDADDLAQGLWNASRGSLPQLSDSDLFRAQRAQRLLETWRLAKDRLPIATFVRLILDDSGHEPALLAEHFGDRKLANVRKIVDKARAFDDQGGFTLSDFVARLGFDLRKTPDEAEAATTDEAGNAIKIMTIHKAKGLEFPIVVVPDLNRKIKAETESFIVDQDLGIVVKSTDSEGEADDRAEGKSLGWLVWWRTKQAAEREEALRLFYVAVTRAQNYLILSSTSSTKRGGDSPAQTLLYERFDSQTGRPRDGDDDFPEGTLTRVINVCPPEPTLTNEAASRRKVRPGELLEWINDGIPSTGSAIT